MLDPVDRCIEFKPKQQDNAVEPDIEHQNEHCPDRTIKFVVAGEFDNPNPEKVRRNHYQDGRKYRTNRNKRAFSRMLGPEFKHD